MPIIRYLQLVLGLNMGFLGDGRFGMCEDFFEIKEFSMHVPVHVFTMELNINIEKDIINFYSSKYWYVV